MRYVLFVCNHNAGRSQMAQAFFERHAPADIRAESAGSTPARAVWPTVVEAMREVGIDIADRRPKKLIRELQLHADWAVTMGCGDACPYVPAKVEDWDIPDVAGSSLEEVREVRDRIEVEVIDLVEHRLDEIRADRTCHELRLQRLIPVLDAEFAGRRSAGEVRTCLDSVLGDYEDAPVRGFVEAIALRRARACLLEDSCAALAAH
jgi:arsenate reductase (thioredoxin)